MISHTLSFRKNAAWAVICATVFVLGVAHGADPLPRRIVSLAPSITEILFALGEGDRVVGVTRYCDYPPEAAKVAKVGGYMDPSYELIVALKPDVVILLDSHGDAIAQLGRVGVRTLSVPHKTIGDIQEAILKIGEACRATAKAEQMVNEMRTRHEKVRRAVAGRDHPSVLICIGRDTDSGQLGGMYMAGRKGFYDEIIEVAGGVNAYTDERVAYPQLSAESVIEIDPEVIVDLASHIKPGAKTPEEMVRQWAPLRMVKAVRNGRVHVIVGTHALRPGPRYVGFLEELAHLLHPEAFGQEASARGKGAR